MKIPPNFHHQVGIHMDIENQHIHILNLSDKNMNLRKIRILINEITKEYNISVLTWNSIFYGVGAALAVSTDRFILLKKDDPRL
ncbi:hypothetical protein [Cytobacillus massiliigabonensis]|uniref:hypothetical protein n=1 Tax=Cytobacillus massiliigabonensis TaxID=1871011 RepID=UPI000C85FD11|nr:hypothetical protein [Cytobacillus massiliigabonensis]